MHNHLPASLIADIAEGRTPLDDSARAHLSVCQHCSSELAWLSRMIAALRASALEEPAQHTVDSIKALFRQRSPRPAVRLTPLAALLRFDSARTTPAFGLRAAAAAARQLLFSAGPYEVDLRVSPVGDRWAVAGQLLGEGLAGPGHAELLGQADSASAELSDESEFTFAPVRAGRYDLTIALTGQSILINDVDLGG